MLPSLSKTPTGISRGRCTPIYSERRTKIGIDVAGESQLVGFPTQYPSVSMVDWNDGNPNARYWVLKLLHDNFGPGDQLVEIDPATPNNPYIYAIAFVTHDAKKRILLVNKRDRTFEFRSLARAGANWNTSINKPDFSRRPSRNWPPTV